MSIENRERYFSRLYLYYMTRYSNNRINEHGAKLKDTLETLIKFGVAEEHSWPYVPENVNTDPGRQAIEEGVYYKLQSYKPVSVEKFKDYLNKGIPIIIGIKTGELFWSINGTFDEHSYKPVNGTDNKQTQGHALTIIGYNDKIKNGIWIVANSLGPKWGYQGLGAFPYECNIDIGEAYIINKFAGIEAGKKISLN